jgi:hypothetical protein
MIIAGGLGKEEEELFSAQKFGVGGNYAEMISCYLTALCERL